VTNNQSDSSYPRSWIWDEDGDEARGTYASFSQGRTRSGDIVPIVNMTIAGEVRAVWLYNDVLRGAFVEEIKARPSGDLDPDELVTARRGKKCQSASNPDRTYREFTVEFEHKRQPSPLDLLSAGLPLGATQPPPPSMQDDADIPF
jgi:hypothetical protein